MSRIPQLAHLKISLDEIKLATNNFSEDNFIGQGGFGRVYKGQLPLLVPTGTCTSSSSSSARPCTTVAVKRLDVKHGQGENEFLKEIVMLASYKHENLASLVGFCDEGGEKIIVYKHEARGSLDNYLATDNLTWVQRLQICFGAARGLNYLHTGTGEGHRVIHRDIKSSNVLLNENWEGKISDFELSRIGPTNQEFTFLVTGLAGTIGYVDPLYLSTGALTKESDVYSFGVVLFEVLCGRLATIQQYGDGDARNMLWRLANDHYEQGKLDEIIFPSIRQQMKPGSLQIFSSIAYSCLKHNHQQRPTMALIIEQLQLALKLQIGCGRITNLWGSSMGGTPWSLLLEPNQKLRKITIDHQAWIYSIGHVVTTQDSSDLWDLHGGFAGPSSGKISEVIFDDDEEMTRIDTTVGLTTRRYGYHKVITSLSFTTNKKRYGPFGEETTTRFSVTCDVGSFAGFFGRAGYYLDGFGCYFKE